MIRTPRLFKIKKKLLSFTPITTLMTLFVISGFTGLEVEEVNTQQMILPLLNQIY